MTGPTARYDYWFGDWNAAERAPPHDWKPRDQVTAMYGSLSRRSFLKPGTADGYTYDCTCKDKNIYAYVAAPGQ